MRTLNPLTVLTQFVKRFDTHADAAAKLDIGPSYLSDLLNGRRPFSDAVLDKLGLRRIVVEK